MREVASHPPNLASARKARVIELRFFGGLSESEAAESLGISLATLKRDWDFARTWLASGGRKMGTILGASFAWRLVEQELR